jgi:hypothetical protein
LSRLSYLFLCARARSSSEIFVGFEEVLNSRREVERSEVELQVLYEAVEAGNDELNPEVLSALLYREAANLAIPFLVV